MRRFQRTGRQPVRFARRSRPARQWLPIPDTDFIVAAAATTTAQVLAFEAPTITPGTAVTSDPPEDQIVDRVVAELSIVMTGSGSWTLGLLLVDRTWTQTGGAFSLDGDKRVLWYNTYNTAALDAMTTGGSVISWQSPNHLVVNGTTTGDFIVECDWRATHLDIQPKVRLEDGKALVFAAWENQGTATFSASTRSMRILMHRAGRR